MKNWIILSIFLAFAFWSCKKTTPDPPSSEYQNAKSFLVHEQEACDCQSLRPTILSGFELSDLRESLQRMGLHDSLYFFTRQSDEEVAGAMLRDPEMASNLETKLNWLDSAGRQAWIESYPAMGEPANAFHFIPFREGFLTFSNAEAEGWKAYHEARATKALPFTGFCKSHYSPFSSVEGNEQAPLQQIVEFERGRIVRAADYYPDAAHSVLTWYDASRDTGDAFMRFPEYRRSSVIFSPHGEELPPSKCYYPALWQDTISGETEVFLAAPQLDAMGESKGLTFYEREGFVQIWQGRPVCFDLY